MKETITPIAACNPYKRKKNKNTYTSGIKHKKEVKFSNLVYTVYPLPKSMYYFVWNYNRLTAEDEKFYINKMIKIKFEKNKNKNKDKLLP